MHVWVRPQGPRAPRARGLTGTPGPEAAGPPSVAPDRCPAAPAAPPHKMASVSQQPRLLPKRRAAPAPGRGRSQQTGNWHGYNQGTVPWSGLYSFLKTQQALSRVNQSYKVVHYSLRPGHFCHPVLLCFLSAEWCYGATVCPTSQPPSHSTRPGSPQWHSCPSLPLSH